MGGWHHINLIGRGLSRDPNIRPWLVTSALMTVDDVTIMTHPESTTIMRQSYHKWHGSEVSGHRVTIILFRYTMIMTSVTSDVSVTEKECDKWRRRIKRKKYYQSFCFTTLLWWHRWSDVSVTEKECDKWPDPSVSDSVTHSAPAPGSPATQRY